MATQVSAAIAKTLQDGEWHSIMNFVDSCGYTIRPEIAFRKGVTEKSGKRFSYSKPNLGHIPTKREMAKYLKDNNLLTDSEIAGFQRKEESDNCINLGKTKIIRDILRGWYNRGHIERRGGYRENVEWRLKDTDWLKSFLAKAALQDCAAIVADDIDHLIDVLWLDLLKGIESQNKTAFTGVMLAAKKWAALNKSMALLVDGTAINDAEILNINQLTDKLWIEVVKGIEKHAGKDALKEAVISMIAWTKKQEEQLSN